MALAHDKEGFLTGQSANIDTASYARHLALLREIRDDGKAMRGDLSAIRKSLSAHPQKIPEIATPAQKSSAANDSRITRGGETAAPSTRTNTSRPAAPAAVPSSPNAGAQAPRELSRSKAAVATPRRADGRFVARGDKPDSAKDEKDARDSREATSKLSEAASDLSRGAGEMLSGAEQVDPTLAAAKEFKDIVSPAFGLFKPLGRLFKRKPGESDAEKAADKSIPWYRRLWFELRDINKKSGGKGGGLLTGLLGGLATLAGLIVKFSGLGMLARLLGSLLGSIPGIPGRMRTPSRNPKPDSRRPSSRTGAPIPDGGGGSDGKPGKRPGGKPPKAPGKFGKLGNALGGLFRGGKGAVKSLLRGVPGLGMLLAGGSIAASIFGGDDPNKSAEENRRDRFSGAGGGVGAIIGGAIGALGGPLGIVVGGILGDMVGSKIGEWMSTVDWSAVGQTITDTWNATAEWTKNAFNGAVGFIRESWSTVTELGSKVFSSVSDWFSEKLGAAKGVLADAANSVKNAAGRVVDTARDIGNAAYDKAAEAGSSAVNMAKNAATTLTGGLYKGGSNANKAALVAEMNAQGIKDPKEQAMFLAQMDHESGGFKSYEENLNYSAKNLRKTFGKYYTNDADAERDARNPEAIANRVYGNRMGNTEPGDGYKYRGRGAIQLTGKDNYARAGKALGLDLVNNPDLAKDPAVAAKIATWYWKDRNLGEAARAGDVTATTKKINGGTNGLEDREAKYGQYLAQANKGDLTQQTGDQTRAVPPPAVAQAISTATLPPKQQASATPVSVVAKPVTYSAAAPDLNKYTPKEAPATTTPIGSSQKKSGEQPRYDSPLTQNVADRNIAAVATGGIGMVPLRG